MKNRRLSTTKRFIITVIAGLAVLLIAGLLSLLLGAHAYSISDLFGAIFDYHESNDAHYYIMNTRMPRIIADIIVGACLSIAGAIMQGTTKNPMADSGIMGISSGSTLGVVIVIAFIPTAGRFGKMGIAALGLGLAACNNSSGETTTASETTTGGATTSTSYTYPTKNDKDGVTPKTITKENVNRLSAFNFK